MGRPDWRTPPSVFAAIEKFFLSELDHFETDAAADHSNHLCGFYWTADNGPPNHELWRGDVWINPPFNDIMPWMKNASLYIVNNNCNVVMLTHANPNSPWFQYGIKHAALYLPDRRINYWHPDEQNTKHGANRDTVVWHFGGQPGTVHCLPIPDHKAEIVRLTAESHGQMAIGTLL